MDYLDEYRKSTGSAENMRSQIQDYIADAARAKLAEDKARAENEVLRRETAALREQLAKLQAEEARPGARRQSRGRQLRDSSQISCRYSNMPSKGELWQVLRSLPRGQ